MQCFVIMPIGDRERDPDRFTQYKTIYLDWIRPAVLDAWRCQDSNADVECIRIDHTTHLGSIPRAILTKLQTAELVVADISETNPNVLYELGVRHALRHGTIMIADRRTTIPFNIAEQRVLKYDYTPEARAEFVSRLMEHACYAIDPNAPGDSPVLEHIVQSAVEGVVDGKALPSAALLERLSIRVSRLEKVREQDSSHILPVANDDEEMRDEDLAGKLTGYWRSQKGSLLCAMRKDGKLLMPYSFEDDGTLTAHYTRIQLLGDALLARFEWFYREIEGYVFYRLATPNTLIGGWWYDKELTIEQQEELREGAPPSHTMRPNIWHRDSTIEEPPVWALTYFENAVSD